MATAVEHDLVIDKEFAEMLGLLTKEERDQLEENIIEAGKAYDPVKVWEQNGKQLIVDGRNRYEICVKHGLPYEVEVMEFADRDAAICWIYSNQLGRRNVTPERQSIFRGRLYKALRKEVGGQGANRHTAAASAESNGEQQEDASASTAERVASMTGVSASTVKADAKFDDALQEISKPIRDKIVNGELKVSRGVVYALAKRSKDEQQQLFGEVKAGHTQWGRALGLKSPAGAKKKKRGKKVRRAADSRHVGQEDELGNEVPEKLIPVFERRGDFHSMARDARALAATVRVVMEGPAGHYLSADLATQLDDLADSFDCARPHSITEDGKDWISVGDYHPEKTAAKK